LQNRLNLAEREKQSAVKLAEANIKNSLQEQLSKKIREQIFTKTIILSFITTLKSFVLAN
jgi:hypothetical protein